MKIAVPWRLLLCIGAFCTNSILFAATPATIRIGILVPVEGPEQASGKAVIQGVEAAVRQWRASGVSAPPGPLTRIVPAQLKWGAQTDALVKAVLDDGATVIIGAADPRTAHLAAQVVTRLKGSALLVTLSEDPTLTEIGVPWILRFPAVGLAPGRLERTGDSDDPVQPTLEAAAHDAALAVLAATAECGSDIDAVRSCLSAHAFRGITGDFTFDTQGNRQPANEPAR